VEPETFKLIEFLELVLLERFEIRRSDTGTSLDASLIDFGAVLEVLGPLILLDLDLISHKST